MKKLTFDAALTDPSAFHILLAVAASDISNMKGSQSSPEADRHRSIALETINKRLSRWDANASDGGISDQNLSAVALFAGHEVRMHNIHPNCWEASIRHCG